MANAGCDALLVVAAALADARGRVLLQRRPQDKAWGGLWEFPGGKVEPGEAPEAALARELAEELGVAVAPGDVTPACFESRAEGGRRLVLLLYLVRRWTGEPRPLAAAALRWARPADMDQDVMPPADRPLVAALDRLLRGLSTA